MDPNATLSELRNLVIDYQRLGTVITSDKTLNDYDRFVELFDALDSWLEKNGALPDEWLPGDGVDYD